MKSSNTSSWKSTKIKTQLRAQGMAEEALVTSSTKELIEFYWSNRKHFPGGYTNFPSNIT